jgi:hypothetical protein
MKIINPKIPINRIISWLLFITLISTVAFKNQMILCVYYKYSLYKISSDNNDAISNMYGVIGYATEAGYTCKNKQSPGTYAYKELTKRKKKQYSTVSNQYEIGSCVELPTGQIILTVNNSITRHYILLEIDRYNPESYHFIDVRGETLG